MHLLELFKLKHVNTEKAYQIVFDEINDKYKVKLLIVFKEEQEGHPEILCLRVHDVEESKTIAEVSETDSEDWDVFDNIYSGVDYEPVLNKLNEKYTALMGKHMYELNREVLTLLNRLTFAPDFWKVDKDLINDVMVMTDFYSSICK